MIVFADIMGMLRDAGYTTYRIKKERLIGGGAMSRIINHESITTNTIDTICRLCHCQPGDIISYEDDKGE